ncbi:afsK, partial [Symbiodinium pilosum]
SLDGKFYAVHALTGLLVWDFDAGSPIKSSPIISDGNIYFGSDNGTFFALSETDGSFVFRFETGAAI